MSARIDEADRLTFWRGWFESFDPLPDDARLTAYDTIMRLAFRDAEPKPPAAEDPMSAVRWMAANMVRATIRISRERRKAGSKGGKCGSNAKPSASKAEANAKQSGSKTKQTRKPRNQEQEQEQVKEQDKEHGATPARARAKLPTISQFVQAAELCQVPEPFARQLYEDLMAAGWEDAAGRRIGNWRRYLKTAYIAEQKKISAARAAGKPATLEDIPMAR